MDIKQISVSDLPANFKEVYNTLKEETDNFKDEDAMTVYEDEINEFVKAVQKKVPKAINKPAPKDEPKPKKDHTPKKTEVEEIMAEEGVSEERAKNILKARKTAQNESKKSLQELISELKENPLYSNKLSGNGIDARSFKPTSRERKDRDLKKDMERTALTYIKRKSPTYGQPNGAKKPFYYEYRENRLDVDRKVRLAKGGQIGLIKAEHKNLLLAYADYADAVVSTFEEGGYLKSNIQSAVTKIASTLKLKVSTPANLEDVMNVMTKLKGKLKTINLEGYWDLQAFNKWIQAPENSSIDKAYEKIHSVHQKLDQYYIGYELGDTYQRYFDYNGMLQYAKKITAETSVEDLEKLNDSLEDVNYHHLSRLLSDVIEAKKDGDTAKTKKTITQFKALVLKDLGEAKDNFSSKHEYISRRQIELIKIKIGSKSYNVLPETMADGLYMKKKEGGKLTDGYIIVDGSNQDYDIIECGGDTLPEDRAYSELGKKKLKNGGQASTVDNMAVDELSKRTGVSKGSIRRFMAEHNLDSSDVMSLVVGIGSKRLSAMDVTTAIVGKANNKYIKSVVAYAKNREGLKATPQNTKSAKFSDLTDYISSRDIESVSFRYNNVAYTVSGKNILDGIYLKKGHKGKKINTDLKFEKGALISNYSYISKTMIKSILVRSGESFFEFTGNDIMDGVYVDKSLLVKKPRVTK